jgi:hypothetical protein
MNRFGQGFPEPLQSVVNHAERFSVALALAETDQIRARASASRELSLPETWLVGRAGEVDSLVGDVMHECLTGLLSPKGAAAAIEFYLRTVHRGMRDKAGLTSPTCCSSAHECVTVDFATPRDLVAMSYPCAPPPAQRRPFTPPPMTVRISEANPAGGGAIDLSRLARTVDIRL